MNENTLLPILARMVQQICVEHEYADLERAEVAEELAESFWNGLLLLLRESIARNQPAVLEEVGIVERRTNAWAFHPAASLLQASALNADATSGNIELARMSVFYLTQATALIDAVAENVRVPTVGGPTPEERLLTAIFGENAVVGQSYVDAYSEQIRAVLSAARGLQSTITRMDTNHEIAKDSRLEVWLDEPAAPHPGPAAGIPRPKKERLTKPAESPEAEE